MRVTAREIIDSGDLEVIARALQAAYTFITQPQRMERGSATYDTRHYNQLTAQIREALSLLAGSTHSRL